MQFHRYSPYSKYEVSTEKLRIWSGGFSQKHSLKSSPNQDRYFFNERSMGVFDGVGGVASIGLDPAAMAHDLNMRVPTEMERRLSHNAQRYDRDAQLTLATSTAARNGGWLRNLCALSFLKTDTLGLRLWEFVMYQVFSCQSNPLQQHEMLTQNEHEIHENTKTTKMTRKSPNIYKHQHK